MKFIKYTFSIFIFFISLFLGLYRLYAPHLNYRIKNQSQLGVIQVQDNLFSDEDISFLKEQMQNTTLISTQITYESPHPYGVQDPIDNRCPGKYHHLDFTQYKCVLSGRIDVAKHAFLQGGSQSLNVRHEKIVQKINVLQNFIGGQFQYKEDQLPVFQKIIESKEYIELVEPICGFKNPYLGNITPQVTLIQPGQELAQHYDAGFLQGIGGTNFPPWLIVAMKNSGLYEDINTPSIQGVTYLHAWDNEKSGQDDGGQLRVWDKGPMNEYKSFEAKQKRVILFDGAKISHQSVTFKPYKSLVDYDKDSALVSFYNKHKNQWDIYSQNGQYKNSVNDQDSRLTIVWRQNCYKNEEQYKDHLRRIEEGDHLKVEDVIENLLQNLIKEGVISKIPEQEIEKAELIIDNYIQYSFDTTKWFPYNICVIFQFTVPQFLLDIFQFESYC